jgi:UDP-GlcNAc:undecaprenyl-phosphate GlcNAc-1-phosphate transferase
VIQYPLTFVLAALVSVYGTPIARRAALRFGIVDAPDGKLKDQKEPVAYLGGLAIYAAVLVALALTFEFDRMVLGLLLAGAIVMVVGLLDDLRAMRPGVKLAGQCLAAIVLVKSGIMIELIYLPIWVAVPMSILWILVITNAFNIIDVMDGLAAGVAAIAGLTLFVVAVLNGRPTIATVALALSGALVGFLVYNFEPATIYMGDTGSLFVGLLLGSLAMIGSYTRVNQVGFLAPLVILAVPLFDLLFVMHVRRMRRQSVFIGSRDHFALRLRRWAFSKRQTVMLSYLVSGVLGVCAVALIHVSTTAAVVILLLLALGLLLCARLLQRIDIGL